MTESHPETPNQPPNSTPSPPVPCSIRGAELARPRDQGELCPRLAGELMRQPGMQMDLAQRNRG